MSFEQSINMAEEIAALVIDKSYWGDQWFLFFCLLVVGLVASISAWGGSYLSTRAQNSAIRADFKEALRNLEEQTNAVKRIEEDISHNYLESREIIRIKRDKIELLYLELDNERKQNSHNLRVLAMDLPEDVVDTPFVAEMLISLYFKNELNEELEYYRSQKNALLTRVKELSEENISTPGLGSLDRFIQNQTYIKNYNQSKVNIEIGLQKMMQNLTSQVSGMPKSGASS
jgi:hypothetical protein